MKLQHKLKPEKHRTTIYLDEGARNSLIHNNVSLSAFVNEQIRKVYGYIETKEELEKQHQALTQKLEAVRANISEIDKED